MESFYTPGAVCAYRGIINDQVWLADSVIVVKDTPHETVLCLLPGARCAYPEGYWRWKLKRDTSAGTRWDEARQEHFHLRQFAWERNRILIFLEPEKFFATFLFWDGVTGTFKNYYINFQLPFRRSHCGFDTLDLDLDLVIDPEYHWEWKDQADYEAAVEQGGIRPEWVIGIEQSQAEVFHRIQNRLYPLDGAWIHWQPASDWQPPALPENWNRLHNI